MVCPSKALIIIHNFLKLWRLCKRKFYSEPMKDFFHNIHFDRKYTLNLLIWTPLFWIFGWSGQNKQPSESVTYSFCR